MCVCNCEFIDAFTPDITVRYVWTTIPKVSVSQQTRGVTLKTIGIVGSRRRNTSADGAAVYRKFLEICEVGDEIVSGGCPQGADNFAERIAKVKQVPIKIYYAEWRRLGRGAGFARNGNIAKDADVLIACVAEDRTGGTEDTIKKYQKLGKTTLFLV